MKFVQKNKMELGDTLIPDLFILNNMPSLEGLDLKLYIYMLFLSKMGKETDKADLAKKLNVTEQEIGFAIERLQGEDLITSYIARPAVTEPPGELIYIVIFSSCDKADRYSNSPTIKPAKSSFISP